MNQNELRALRHAADGLLLFHNGLWGASAGYRWAAPDGTSAGYVPQWECEALDLLERRSLVTIRPGAGPRDVPVVVTGAGLAALSTVEHGLSQSTSRPRSGNTLPTLASR